jgi:poly-gamma-glutamate synthesis protein (capsule biosynthesis protein)
VFSFASTTSGIPREWGAANQRAGVNLLPDLSEDTAHRVAAPLQRTKRRGDVAIASIHWGSNWGFDVSDEQIRFAHKLVDDGFDIIHGHSSHHVRPIELYRDRLIMYGCGDFIDDYEGIGGYEAFRGDLKLMYLTDVDAQGQTRRVRLVPMRMIRFRLTGVSDVGSQWLCDLLNRLSSRFATRVELAHDGSLAVRSLGEPDERG